MPPTWAAVLAVALGAGAAADEAPPLDPLQQAVVDSLDIPRRTAPADLLEAAIRACDVEAFDAAAEAFRRLGQTLAAAGDGLPDLLADLGDASADADLGRLARSLATREPKVGEVVTAIRDAAALRRRDPRRLAAAVEALGSESARERGAAAATLARAGVDALPVLVDAVARAPSPRVAALARDIVREMGPAAREPLLRWLGSADVERWPAVIALLAETGGLGDDATFLLAPAVVADAPPAARAAALEALALREPPAAAAAAARVAARLDRVLSPAGLPERDHGLLEPVREPGEAAAAFGGILAGAVERWAWDAESGRPVRVRVSPRAARALEADHLARDLGALGPESAEHVRLVLLARLESLLVAAGEPETAVSRLGRPALRAALEPPGGFSPEVAAEVLDTAVEHGLWEAAAAVAAALEPPTDTAVVPLSVAVRRALVRALAVPDPALEFAAARALAQAAGDPPWPGSSRVIEVLVHAATAAGADVAVVAHPDAFLADRLAAGVTRFGYRAVCVGTGREAILAARSSADTVLVLLAARLARPTALETVEFLRHQGVGGEPPVLVVVDPLDDDGRGRFLQRVLVAFRDQPGTAVVDGLDSFFAGTTDPATGSVILPPRFTDALARCAGPAAVDPAARAAARTARHARAADALALLGDLGRRGQDVSAALDPARHALVDPEFAAPAAALLATIGRPAAQQVLAAEATAVDVVPAARELAARAFAASVERYGLLLRRTDVRDVVVNYTGDPDAAVRKAAHAIIDVIETSRTHPVPPPLDVAPVRPW